MEKFVATMTAAYDRASNTVTTKLRDTNGEEHVLQIDGKAFSDLVAAASFQNAISNLTRSGSEVPVFPVIGFASGMVTNQPYSMILSLVLQGIGAINFGLPPTIEMALRQKLQKQES